MNKSNDNKSTAIPSSASSSQPIIATLPDDTASQSTKAIPASIPTAQAIHEIDYPDIFEYGMSPPDLYFNRELSLLQFHQRVLAQAKNPAHPLLERLFFLIIFSSNLDEFFEIRVAGLMQKKLMGDVVSSIDGMRPSQVLSHISTVAHKAVAEQYRILNEELLPALAQQHIRYLKRDELTAEQAAWVKDYFDTQVAPVLTPISIDPAHPFPRLVNKSLNFMVSLEGKDAFGRAIDLAVVPAPRSLPRVIRLPDHLTDGKEHHIMLTAVIHEHIDELFMGMKVTGVHQFRLTRNADLDLADDVEDLAKALEGELENRRFGAKVRLEVTTKCPDSIVTFLLEQFGLSQEQLYQVNGPVNLTRLLFDFNIPNLRYPSFTHMIPKAFRRESMDKNENVFHAIRQQDVLLHHPFHAFAPVVNLIRQAAQDPNVLAIKQTLYRSGANSEIVQALAEAARNGKEVTAVIELRARFDEKSNIDVANLLQQAGAVVVYGIVGYKTHAKLMLIVRREDGKIRRYAHLGTGNYHAGNAKAYTDYGLFTANTAITEDVHKIFNELTGMGKPAKVEKLLHAPFTLHDKLMDFIDDEIVHAKAGRHAHIIIKVNALTEKQLIDKLYEASQAGVQVDLIIRSMCCLRPQLAGVSENIRVRSVIGRFLEHTRVYYFANGNEYDIDKTTATHKKAISKPAKTTARLYCASADWMERNLFSRVEVAFPIEDPIVLNRIMQDIHNYLKDNVGAWQLDAKGTWTPVLPSEGEPSFSAQAFLLDKIVLNKNA